MEYKITGTLCDISNVRNISDRFRKREFVIVVDETINMKGYTNPQYIKFQLEQSNVLTIDEYKIGDEITVIFDIRGNKTEAGLYFTNLRATKIEINSSFCSPAPTPHKEGKIRDLWPEKQKPDNKIPVPIFDIRLFNPDNDTDKPTIPTLPF